MTEKDNPAFIERFTVRMPDGMRDAIADRAKENGRSMNSEIIQLIEDGLKKPESDLAMVWNEESEKLLDKQQKMLAQQNELVRYLMGEMTAILKGIMPDHETTKKYEAALKGLNETPITYKEKP